MSHSAPAEWRLEVANGVRAALDASDFGTLLQRLPSADPAAVADVLAEWAANGDQRAAQVFAAQPPVSVVPSRPIAHPLDFDWRFTDDTNAMLLERLGALAPADAVIGHFGAPTTWRAAASSGHQRHVLLDRKADRYGEGEAFAIDLFGPPPSDLTLAAAVVDPPWYPEYHNAFLAAAAACVVPGGHVLASFPPPLTRPDVLTERRTIVENAVRAGLIVVDEAPLALRYQTPPFEAAAFAVDGLRVPSDWRRGDLLTFAKRRSRIGEPERVWEAPAMPVSDDARWTFVVYDDIPLAVSANATPSGDALLTPAVPGATLGSVSRRHPARSRAALWSSMNRIYASSAPARLAAVVVAAADGRDPLRLPALRSVSQEDVRRVANKLRELVQRERQEHGL